MQVPKRPPSPSLFMTFNRALYMGMLKHFEGCIYFWMGGLFPFVSDMRHKLLNLSSVRHSTNLQFTNKEFSVGWNCRVTQKKGKIICKLVHCNVLSESWNGCLPWYAEEGFLGFCFWIRHAQVIKPATGPPSPTASTGVQWHTPITLAIRI